MAYERINWQNGEVGNTPLNANNLNRMDMAIEEHDQKIGDHDYEIENLKTGAQGITEELNKKMDRINPQGSGTLSIPAVNADNITAQTVEADEIKVTKVGSKGGTAPVVFDNDIMVKGINAPIGGLAALAKASAEHASGRAEDAYLLASRANREAASAINLANDNKAKIDLHTGLIGEGVGSKEVPVLGYLDGYYIAPNGSVTQYNATATVIKIDFLDFLFRGDNIIFNHVDLLPTENCIPCAWYDISGNFISAADGLNIIAEFDEQTFKITKQYIDSCIIPVPAGASSCKLSGLANGRADIRIQTSLSEAIKELQSKPEPTPLVLTNPSPLPATDGKKILGIDSLGKSWQDGTPTPENAIPITDASNEVTAIGKNLLDVSQITDKRIILDNGSINTNDSACASDFIKLESGQYTFASKKVSNDGTVYIRVHAYDSSKNWLQMIFKSTNAYTASGEYVATFTMPTDAKYIRICWYRDNADSQLELGTTATSYVPYQSNSVTLPFEPKSVGSVANELIVNEDGSAKIVQRVGTTTIGALDWRTSSSGVGRFYADIADGSAYTNPICSTYKYSSTAYEEYTISSSKKSSSEDTLRIYVGDTRYTSASEFKSAMSNAVIYYALYTPIETPLTPEEVASIRQLMTYKGTTVIDSEMQIDSVTYSADVKGYVDSKTDYSYTDTIIGKWADGKDLHRMVIQTNTPSTADTASYVSRLVNSAKCSIKNYYGCFLVSGIYISINYGYDERHSKTNIDSYGISMTVSSGYVNSPCEITVEYTLKDSAPAAASVLSLDETEE